MNKRLLFLLFAGVLMGALDIAIMGPALPAIQKTFQATHRDLSWILNVYVLANLIGSPLLAKLSDLYGRRILYVLSVSFFAAGSIIVILASNFDMLLLGRGIQGFGAGGFFPVASAVIGDTFPKEKQGSALGLIGAVFGFAFIFGPFIAGFLLMISWHWIFIINLPFAAVLIVGAIKLIPSKQNKGRIIFDWMGMLLLIGVLTLFTLSINEIDTVNFWHSVSSSKVLPYLIASIVLMPVLAYSQYKSPAPTLSPDLFKSRQLILAYIIALGAGLAEVSVMFIPGFIKDAYGFSDYGASWALLPLMLALFFGSPIAGKMLDVLGARIVLIMGSSLSCIGLLGIAFSANFIVSFYASEVLLGLGLAAVLGAPLRYIINHETTNSQRALGQGIVSVFLSIGLLVSAALIGALISSWGGGIAGFQRAFQIIAFVSVLMILASLGLKRHFM
jgi:MFS family permease